LNPPHEIVAFGEFEAATEESRVARFQADAKWAGYLEISWPAIADAGDMALVLSMGGGYAWYVLVKDSGGWKVKETRLVWVS